MISITITGPNGMNWANPDNNEEFSTKLINI